MKCSQMRDLSLKKIYGYMDICTCMYVYNNLYSYQMAVISIVIYVCKYRNAKINKIVKI